MDPATLAASAVGFLAAELVRLTGKGFEDAASARLYQLISTQLRKAELGQQIFEKFEGNPAEIPNQAQLTGAVTTQATNDPEFAEALREVVNVLNAQPDAGTSEKNTVRFAGNMTRSTIMQADTVDQSKRRYSFGGIPVAVVAVVAILAIGGGGYGAYQMTQPAFPELEGNWRNEERTNKTVLHFADDRFTVDITAGIGHAYCAGKVSYGEGGKYNLTVDQGTCPQLAASVSEDGKTLEAMDSKGRGGQFVKDG